MSWYADTGTQVQNVVAQISTRLQNGGWTLYDNVAGAPVLSSTNNQGVTQYLQVSQSGSYTYIQLQAWKSWNSGTHVGTAGSSTSIGRLYFGGSAQGATITCDLYMSVNTNRAIIHINTQATNYRAWGYFGGLGTLAGTNDPGCTFLVTSYESAGFQECGQILQSVGGSSTNWTSVRAMSLWETYGDSNSPAGNVVATGWQGITANGNQMLLYPILIGDDYLYTTAYTGGFGTMAMRGDLDGLYWCPLGSNAGASATFGYGTLGHLDTVIGGAVTYLVIQPGGTPTNNVHPWTGSYAQGLAIAEV